MIIKETKHLCPDCSSDQLKRNGFTGGKQKYKCKTCGRYGSLNPQQSYSQEVRDQILSAYLERPSIRGRARRRHLPKAQAKHTASVQAGVWRGSSLRRQGLWRNGPCRALE